MPKIKRIVIYTKDVVMILGRTERSALNLLHRIKAHYNKKKYQLVYIREFCEYTGLDEKVVQEQLD
jgi:hypothetical protein